MEIALWEVFQGIMSFFQADVTFGITRVILTLLGIVFIFTGYKRILEPLLMIPIGLGMALVNVSILQLPGGQLGTLFLSTLAEEPSQVVNALQIYFLQPIYTLTFSNGLIACLIFLGIGAITDLDFLMAKPWLSMMLAIPAELGTLVTYPLAVMFGFNLKEAAAIAVIGGADGPMVLYASMLLAKDLFVVITVVSYLYLSIIYALYPYMIKATIPKAMRGVLMSPFDIPTISSSEKFVFAVITGVVLCLLFPVAAPLIAFFFFGVAIKESGIDRFKTSADIILSSSTMFLGFVLGTTLSADVVLNPKVFPIMILGLTALILSGIGGLMGGVLAYKLSGRKINPLLGIAAVSCVPTTAKIAQQSAKEVDRRAMILPHAMGPNVAGVITTAILTSFYIAITIGLPV